MAVSGSPAHNLMLPLTCHPRIWQAKVVQLVRDRIGPVASFKAALVVARLPKTRSDKIPQNYDAPHRLRRALDDAGDDRRPGHPRRDQANAVGLRVM